MFVITLSSGNKLLSTKKYVNDNLKDITTKMEPTKESPDLLVMLEGANKQPNSTGNEGMKMEEENKRKAAAIAKIVQDR